MLAVSSSAVKTTERGQTDSNSAIQGNLSSVEDIRFSKSLALRVNREVGNESEQNIKKDTELAAITDELPLIDGLTEQEFNQDKVITNESGQANEGDELSIPSALPDDVYIQLEGDKVSNTSASPVASISTQTTPDLDAGAEPVNSILAKPEASKPTDYVSGATSLELKTDNLKHVNSVPNREPVIQTPEPQIGHQPQYNPKTLNEFALPTLGASDRIANNAATVQPAPIRFQASIQINDPKSSMEKQLSLLIKDKAEVQISSKQQQAVIRLDPPELGRIELKVKLENEKLHISVHSNSQSVKDAVSGTVDKLKTDFSHYGHVAVDVSDLGGSDSSDNVFEREYHETSGIVEERFSINSPIELEQKPNSTDSVLAKV